MANEKTPDQLRDMIRRGLKTIVASVTPADEAALERAMADIPERSKRPKPETKGMREAAMLAVRSAEIAWFRTHPDESEYIRRAVPGEFPPDITAEWVRVVRLTPDASERVRSPVVRVPGKNGLEWQPWQGVVPDQGLEP